MSQSFPSIFFSIGQGDDIGFAYLVDLICNKPEQEWLGEIIHRLHWFDDTGQHLIWSFIYYDGSKIDIGSNTEISTIRHKMYPAIKKLVFLSQSMDFAADAVFFLITHGCTEYISIMKEYLQAILQDPNCCRYKVADAISGLIHLDKPWLVETLAKHGKKFKDYPKGHYYDEKRFVVPKSEQ